MVCPQNRTAVLKGFTVPGTVLSFTTEQIVPHSFEDFFLLSFYEPILSGVISSYGLEPYGLGLGTPLLYTHGVNIY